MGTVYIRETDGLKKIYEAKISMALKMTQDEIYKTIQRHIYDYYKEPVFNGSPIPAVYDRKYKFLNSIIKTKLVMTPGGINCTIEVDSNYLKYKYPGKFTGQDVWDSANNMFHGNVVEGDLEVWNDAMAELGLEPGIEYIMIQNMRKCGIPIK